MRDEMIVTSVNLSVWGWIMSLVRYVWMNFFIGFNYHSNCHIPFKFSLAYPLPLALEFPSNFYSKIFR